MTDIVSGLKPIGPGSVPGPAHGGLTIARALRNDPPEGLRRLRERYGHIVRFKLLGLTFFLVSEPAAVQEAFTRTGRTFAKGMTRRGQDPAVPGEQPLARLLGTGLLTSHGEMHKRQRRLMQPLFHRERIAGYAEAFGSLAEQHAASWPTGEIVDLHARLTDLTLAVIARTVFDVSLEGELVRAIRSSIDEVASAGTGLSISVTDRVPFLPATRRRRRVLADLHRLVDELIVERRREGAAGADLLSLLLSARDAETGEPMDDQQVHDEALTILMAGHETMANALSWTFHLLGRNPEVQARLLAELDETLGGRTPTMADVPNLRYAEAVFNESMRMYPPAWITVRHLTIDWEVCGHRLPAGSTLLLSPYVVHHDPELWPEPDAFRPERWLEAGARHRYAFFPFGGGPRQCIGNSFAELEGLIVLSTLAQRRRVESPPGSSPGRRAAVTLRPRNGLPMLLHRR